MNALPAPAPTPPHASPPPARKRSWVPVGTVTFLTATLRGRLLRVGAEPLGQPGGPRPGRQRRVHAVQPRRADAVRAGVAERGAGSRRAAGAPAAGAGRRSWCSPATPSPPGTCSRCTQNPPVSWADPFYLSDSLLTLVALLSFPLARRTRLERWKFVLDAAMVLVGGGVAIWYFSVRPTAASQESSIVVTLLAFAYPLVSMLVLLGVTTVLLRRPIDGNRRGVRPAGDRRVGGRRARTSPSTWCSSRPAAGARAGPTRCSSSAT